MPERRRLITIHSAATTGSTALGESLDPEDVRALGGGRRRADARLASSPHQTGNISQFALGPHAVQVSAVAEALAVGDRPRHITAIDAVDARGLPRLAAHMRLVLAARSVLENLSNTLSLRKLDVSASNTTKMT